MAGDGDRREVRGGLGEGDVGKPARANGTCEEILRPDENGAEFTTPRKRDGVRTGQRTEGSSSSNTRKAPRKDLDLYFVREACHWRCNASMRLDSRAASVASARRTVFVCSRVGEGEIPRRRASCWERAD